MQMKFGDLRKIVSEEVRRALSEAKKKDDDDAVEPDLSTHADDSFLLDEPGVIVEPDVRRSIKKYFLAMGLAGKLPKHARMK